MNDFYFYGHETAYLDDTWDDKTNTMKFSFTGAYFIKDDVALRVKAGYAIRRDQYARVRPTEIVDYTIEQNVVNVNPGISFQKKWERFKLTTGFEIPLFFVNQFLIQENYTQKPDSVNIAFQNVSTLTMPGGMMFGLNHFVGIRYQLNDVIGIGAEFNYGLLYSKLGGEIVQEGTTTIPAFATSVYKYTKTYNKLFFSSPEISMGIYFNLTR